MIYIGKKICVLTLTFGVFLGLNAVNSLAGEKSVTIQGQPVQAFYGGDEGIFADQLKNDVSIQLILDGMADKEPSSPVYGYPKKVRLEIQISGFYGSSLGGMEGIDFFYTST